MSIDFEILLIAYAFDDEEIQIIDLASGEELPQDFLNAFQDPLVKKHAHNAAFERLAFNQAGYPTEIKEWQCSMVKAMAHSLPGSLEHLGHAIGLDNDMKKIKEPDITFDRCEKCGGVFLEKGELNILTGF